MEQVHLDRTLSLTTPSRSDRFLWSILYGLGVVATLVVYGLMQERIMTIPFGNELFTVSTFLVFCNRIVNTAYAASMAKVSQETLHAQAPLWKYMVISFSNVAATTFQYECLKYVSFPTLMLGKTFKMMPVMLWGMYASDKKYSILDWVVAACVSCGAGMFCITGPTGVQPNDPASSIKGMALLFLFLFCDGFTTTYQEKLFKEDRTTKFNQMFYVNGCSMVTSFATLLAMGSFVECLAFSARHSDFLWNVLLLSVVAAASQYFIYSQVQEFGALAFAATINVRQVVSILVSNAAYAHALTRLQSSGLAVVFGALFYKSFAKSSALPKRSVKMPWSPITTERERLACDDKRLSAQHEKMPLMSEEPRATA